MRVQPTQEIKTQQVQKSMQQLSLSQMVSSVGILRYENGDMYEGQLLNGLRSGQGQLIFSNGDKYIGMWK